MKTSNNLNLSKLFSFVISVFILYSCASFWEDDILVGSKEYFEIEYDTRNGRELSIFDKTKYVKLGNERTVITEKDNGQVALTIKNVTVQSNSFLYDVGKIEIEKCDNDCSKNRNWVPGSTEEQAGLGKQKTNVNAVIVLDVSISLSSKSSEIIEFSKNFTKELFKSYDSARVALVAFDGEVNTIDFKLKDEESFLLEKIDEFGRFNDDNTKLFEAVKKGQELLKQLNSKDENFLVVFSDGGDTNSSMKESLKSEITNNYPNITRYVIALKGDDFDSGKNDLKLLATDSKRTCQIINNVSKLKEAFSFISRQVGQVFDIEYTVGDATGNLEYFRFVFKKLKPIK